MLVLLAIIFLIIYIKYVGIIKCPYYKKIYYYIRSNRYDIDEKFRTIYQNYKIIGDKIVFLDGFSKKCLFDTYTLDAYSIYLIIEIAKRNSFKRYDKDIEYQIKIALLMSMFRPNYIKYNVNYKNYNNYKKKLANYDINLCSKTMRPYLVNPVTKKFWKVESEKQFGPLNTQIHIYTYFGNYVSRYNKYPSKDEMLYYTYLRMKARNFSTVPKEIDDIVDKLFVSFEKILGPSFSEVSVDLFKKIFNESSNNKNRHLMENQ